MDHLLADSQDSSVVERDLMILIIDLNPVWWGLNGGATSQWSLKKCLESVMALCNAHTIMRLQNEVAVIGVTTDSSHYLFPLPCSMKNSASKDGNQGQSETMETEVQNSEGKYEVFEVINNAMRISSQALVRTQTSLRIDLSLAGAVSKALCFYHRRLREFDELGTASSRRLKARILIIKGSEDNPSQYMSLMNAVFTAQKFHVFIDSCILGRDDSSLLQQAADLTGGLYLRIDQTNALLQYLLTVFLPRPALRTKLIVPGRPGVDFRAACFCHRQLIDVGYVCSVCLSVFCAFSPFCTTCQSQFKIRAVAKKEQRKQKKNTS